MELFLEGLGIHEPEIGEDSEIAGWNWEFAGRQFEQNRPGCWLWDSRFGISRVSSPVGPGEMILWAIPWSSSCWPGRQDSTGQPMELLLIAREIGFYGPAHRAPPVGPGIRILRASPWSSS